MNVDNKVKCGVFIDVDETKGPVYWDPATNDIMLTMDGDDSVLHGLECTSARAIEDGALDDTLTALAAQNPDIWAVFGAEGALFVVIGEDTGEAFKYVGSAEAGPAEQVSYEIFEAN